MEAEFTSPFPIRRGDLDVIIHDYEGNIFEIPECKKCKKPMTPVIGVSAMTWYCHEHGFNSKDNEAL